MNHELFDETDFYNFPDKKELENSLYWMGENYLLYLKKDFLNAFQKQDPKTILVGIKCEEVPEFSYYASAMDGKMLGIDATFHLQFLLLDGSERHWRINGICKYFATELNTVNMKVKMDFEISKSEEV